MLGAHATSGVGLVIEKVVSRPFGDHTHRCLVVFTVNFYHYMIYMWLCLVIEMNVFCSKPSLQMPSRMSFRSIVNLMILAKMGRQALPHKAYPFSPCGRTRSIMPPQILTDSYHYLFILNGLRFSHRLMWVIKPPQNDHRMTFCEILNSPQELSHGAG